MALKLRGVVYEKKGRIAYVTIDNALDLLITGRWFDAKEAYRIGAKFQAMAEGARLARTQLWR